MSHDTEPTLVTTARALVADGMPWRQVADQLAASANGDRPALAEATLHWSDGMRGRRSDDFQALAVLRALETATARTPVVLSPA